MFQSNRFLSWVIVVGLAAVMSGCGSWSSSENQKSARPTENTEHGDPSSVSSPGAAEGLAELSDADAAVAKKQRICPVSDSVLGTMGKPYKVTVRGKDIFLCCSGCEGEIRKNPEKYLSKMEK